MKPYQRQRRIRDSVLLSGWLFADLLLGLAVIFLAANTIGITPQARATPTPQTTPTPMPSPTPLPILELKAHHVSLNVDTEGLLNNSSEAINNFKQRIRALGFLQGRRAGLVIAYGGANNTDQIPRAQAVSLKVMSLLHGLGKENFVFMQTAFYDPLYNLGDDPNHIVLDIYLFTQPA
ncbi:hypothetical protein EPA93_34425 [Ktedonosporobacter rubrisoli]|uniref:Uncharacterized protein n=1 Tax=Ktedonosporobacter rubrisoli TaxID=2509675 RepID=A0A4P6JZ66_KTERU|nr:hypothetical protein [Ktedonosporobacter rubrisoli]QBD80792.1 hypothetical protein EPA93_34425 [Ktedonosporobacter rubrisoli]